MAELSVPARADSLLQLAGLADRAGRAAANRLNTAQHHLDRLRAQLGRPTLRLAQQALKLGSIEHRLPSAARLAAHTAGETLLRLASRFVHGLDRDRANRGHALQHLATRLAACDPKLVVSRGYALVQLGNGELVVDPRQLHSGAELGITLARGRAQVRLGSAQTLPSARG